MKLTGKAETLAEPKVDISDIIMNNALSEPKKAKKREYKGLTAPMCLYLLGLKLYPYPQLHLTSAQIKEALAWHLQEAGK